MIVIVTGEHVYSGEAGKAYGNVFDQRIKKMTKKGTGDELESIARGRDKTKYLS